MDQSSCIDDRERPEYRFGEFFRLDETEWQALASLPGPVKEFPRGHVLRRVGVEPAHVYLLLEGWAASSMPLPSGKQQTVKVHLPKDLMGAPSLCLVASAECLSAITPVTVRAIARSDLMATFVRYPRIAASMFMTAQKERIALMESLAVLGQSEALARMAGMLVALHDRLTTLGLTAGPHMPFPLTQQQVGDLIGISSVHVNRVLRQLDHAGLVQRQPGSITLLDMQALRSMSGLIQQRFQHEPPWVRFD